MSPSQGHAPRTPDRRSSSSALFGAFRSLTSGRFKSPTPPPSTSSATYTPARTASDSLASPSTTSADGSLRRLKDHARQGHGRSLWGGPPELDELAEKLHKSHPFAERSAAVDQICKILEEYAVENVLELWSPASDLLLPEQSDEAAEAGYKLLMSCATLPKLTSLERSVLFDAASLRKHDRNFDTRLRIISALTKGGRDVEACDSSLAHFILTSFDTCFEESVHATKAARKTSGKKSTDKPTKERESLAAIFQFAIDVCKFNSKVLSDDDLDLLLKKAMAICQETTQRRDIENSIRLFDTIITYVHIPNDALRPCLEVLCAVYRQLEDLQEATWNTLSNLFKSHVGQAAVSALLRTLLDGPVRKNRQSSTYRGTIHVLQQLLLENGRNGLPKVSIPLLVHALKATVREAHKTQEELVIDLIDAILAEERMREVLVTEADWSGLTEIIYTCAERDDDRLRARMEKLEGKEASGDGPTPSNKGPNGTTGSAVHTVADADADTISNLELTAPASKVGAFRRNAEDKIFQVLVKLEYVSNDLDFAQKATAMELFMRLAHRVSDATAENVIRYYAEERYFHPSNAEWLEACRCLVSGILEDRSRPRSLRRMVISILREIYTTIEKLCPIDSVLQCGALLLNSIEAEADVEILHELVDFAVDVAHRASDARFPEILHVLKTRLERCSEQRSLVDPSSSSWTSSLQPKSARRLGSPCNVVVTAFVRLFIRSVTESAQKTRMLYEILRHIAGNDQYESDARLAVLRLLFRLRADSNHALIVSASSEGESIAAILCRTEETAVTSEKSQQDGAPLESSRSDDQSALREHRKVSGSPHSSLSRHTSRYPGTTGRASRPIPPLWMYPGPRGLPEEPSPRPSRVVFAHVDAEYYPLSEDILDLEVTLWLELVISLLQKCQDWELYSYVVVHLGPQLSNQALVRSCVPQLKMLRSVIGGQLHGSTFRDPPAPTLLKKADVAVCLYHILTVLISYHDHFEKSEEDDLVKIFIYGMTFWDRTAKWCIHALSVCCHEVPLSVSKSLDTILARMSQVVTKPATAIHILDFLTSLARMPELYKNFRLEDFRLVFGVSFAYLRHIREQRDRAAIASSSQPGLRSLRHSGASRDFAAYPDPSLRKPQLVEDEMPQYLYSLAYHVITFWFMALKMEDRPKMMSYITKELRIPDVTGRPTDLEEQGHVIVDMMNMFSYSDRDETTRNPNFAKPGDGEIWKKTWIVGHSLVTIETAARTGVSQITNRRPCGTRFLTARPQLAPPPRHQIPLTVGLASEAFYSSSYVGILPDDIFQTFYAPLNSSVDSPVPLPDDDISRRAVEMFDRISTVDSYKVGVIYIGEGQTNERDILMNDMGSPAYTSFLSDLGTLCRLKDAKFNTGGLDTRNDMNGELTYAWRDRCIELVFHVPTMMPTNRDDDLSYINKKQHIGNDCVNIIYNESGLPYNFNTFPGAFNYVHIVISPESQASFVDRRLDTDPDGKNRYYKVQVISKPGFPDISPAAEPKILAGKHLAAYCRLIAINASVFSQVWIVKDGGEVVSSWRSRWRAIQRLRERYGAEDPKREPQASPVSPTPQHHHQHQHQHLSSPSSRDNNLATQFKRTSVATYISEGTSRSSMTSSSHDAAN